MKRLVVFVAAGSWLAYLAALFLPAVGLRATDASFTGWECAVLAACSLDDFRSSPFRTVVSVLSSLTNLVMLATPWAVFRLQRQRASWVFVATVVSVFVNCVVFASWSHELSFGPGYYVWVASFILVAVALVLARHAGERWFHGVTNPRVA